MQLGLMHETISEALAEIVKAAGGYKPVGCRLWPEMAADHAGNKLRDCLNHDRREKLSPDQVILLLKIGREIGVHSAIHFMARECGYTDPAPIDPEDERNQLMREFIDAQKSMQQMVERMARMNDQTVRSA